MAEEQNPNFKQIKTDIQNVTKRDGTLAPFDETKIYNAILKAGTSTGEFGESDAWLLTAQVMKVINHKFSESLPSIEQIQDIVEQVLISANYFATSKAYILYRDQRNRMRADKKVMVDVESSINEYLETGNLLPDPTVKQQAEWALEYAKKLCEEHGESVAMRELRGIIPHFFSGSPGYKKVRVQIASSLTTMDQLEKILEGIKSREHC